MRTAVADAAADHARSRPLSRKDDTLPPDGVAHTSSAVDVDELRELVRLFPLSEVDGNGAIQLDDFSAMMRVVCTETSGTHRLTPAEVARPAHARSSRTAGRGLSAQIPVGRRRGTLLMADVGTRGALTCRRRRLLCNLPLAFRRRPYATPSGPLGRHHPQRTAASALSSRVDSDYEALLQQRAESAGIGVCAARTRRFSPLASAKFVACTPEEAGLDLSLEDLEQMRLTFAANDLNKDGVIDLPEFEQMMARLARQKGKRYSKAQVSLPSLSLFLSPPPPPFLPLRVFRGHASIASDHHRRRSGARALPPRRH